VVVRFRRSCTSLSNLQDDVFFFQTVADAGFGQPDVGTGLGAYQYNPVGSAWTFDDGSGVAGDGSAFTYGNPDAPGGQVAFLQGHGSFSQAVSLAAGTYSLGFLAAQRGNYQEGSGQTFQVLVDGVVVGTFTPGGTDYAAYRTDTFTVGAGVHTIRFVGLGPDGLDNTAFIDQVSLNPVA
jgi:hypothetical protein